MSLDYETLRAIGSSTGDVALDQLRKANRAAEYTLKYPAALINSGLNSMSTFGGIGRLSGAVGAALANKGQPSTLGWDRKSVAPTPANIREVPEYAVQKMLPYPEQQAKGVAPVGNRQPILDNSGMSNLNQGMPENYWQDRANRMGLGNVSLRAMREGQMDYGDPMHYVNNGYPAQQQQQNLSTWGGVMEATRAGNRAKLAQQRQHEMGLERLKQAGTSNYTQGQMDIEKLRQTGRLAEVEAQAKARAAEREEDKPYREAQASQALATAEVQKMKLAELQNLREAEGKLAAAQTRLAALPPDSPDRNREITYINNLTRQIMMAKGIEQKAEKEDPAKLEALKVWLANQDQKVLDDIVRTNYPALARGGLVEAYAEGGLIAPQTPNPVLAQYGQYLASAKKVGAPPISVEQFMAMQQQARAAIQQSRIGYAAGGEVGYMDDMGEDDMGGIPVAGRQLVGPGTGTSDSIPAVIDGHRPAALSSGEFVIPASVVRAKGTEFFEKLIAQYSGDKNDKS